ADSLTLLFPPDYTAKGAALNYLWKDLYVFDLYPQLKNITAPTLILHGDSDSLPLDIAQKLHRSIAGSTMIVLNNSGHFPYIETPDEFVRTIRNFMTSAGSKRND
ncbi:MAG TPA: alpha/beta hydrolase, partial [Bacteroidota bacterium]